MENTIIDKHTISEVGKNAQTKVQINWVGVRGNREPIDSSSVMLTYTELQNYLNTNDSVYDGQLVSVSNLENETYNGIYYIRYLKDINNNYSYIGSKLRLDNDSLLLEKNIIDNEKVVSLMNNFLHDNICKNEEVISVAINYLYSYIEKNHELLSDEIQKNEVLITDYLSYVFHTINNITKVRVDDNKASFKDYNGNDVYLKIRNEGTTDFIYFDIYKYPIFNSFNITTNGSSSLEYGDNNREISVNGINYNIDGSYDNYRVKINLKKYSKNSEGASWTTLSSSEIETIENSISNYTVPNNIIERNISDLKKNLSDSDVKWGYKIGISLTLEDEKGNTDTTAEKSIETSFYTKRYYLKLSTDSISQILNSSQLTEIDRNGNSKNFTNYRLPSSSSGEYIYLLFRPNGNYSSCILNGASPSDNINVYGPVRITNQYGKELDYYYWKKQLGNVEETVTLK